MKKSKKRVKIENTNAAILEHEADEEKKRIGQYYRKIEYADDVEVHTNQVPRDERISYWQHLLSTSTRRKVPEGQITWVDENRTNVYDVELRNYPYHKVLLLRIMTSGVWDYLFLLLLAIWLVLVSAKLTATPLSVLDSFTLVDVQLLPLGGMFLCQLIPVAAVSYFLPCCNDLTRFIAQSSLGFW
eukprot:gene11595-24274_t